MSVTQYDWSIGLLDAKILTGTIDPNNDPREALWYRGEPTEVLVELTEQGAKILKQKRRAAPFLVTYHNGPIFIDLNGRSRAPIEILAQYRSEVVRTASQGATMINSPAVISACYGDGRVMAVGPHFERDHRNHWLLLSSINWLLGA